jgi:hypothetical protein
MFRRPYSARHLSLTTSEWVLDGAFKITNISSGLIAVVDATAEKFQFADSRVFSKRTYADCHYFTRESVNSFRKKFPGVHCRKIAVALRVDDPLNYGTTQARYLLDSFPPIVVVPTASGYEMSVTCEDRDHKLGEDNALLEVSCPGLESDTDVCVHKFTALRRRSSTNVAQTNRRVDRTDDTVAEAGGKTPTVMRPQVFAFDSRDVRRQQMQWLRAKYTRGKDFGVLLYNISGSSSIVDRLINPLFRSLTVHSILLQLLRLLFLFSVPCFF